MYFNKAISLACKMLASRRPFRVQVKPTTFPMMLSYNGNCPLQSQTQRLAAEYLTSWRCKPATAVPNSTGPLLRICNWVGHLSQGTKNNVKRGPEKNRNFEKSKNRKIEKIEKSKFCRSKFPI